MGGIRHTNTWRYRDGRRVEAVEHYLLAVGVLSWLLVRLLWNDRAIIMIHFVALGSMLAGHGLPMKHDTRSGPSLPKM